MLTNSLLTNSVAAVSAEFFSLRVLPLNDFDFELLQLVWATTTRVGCAYNECPTVTDEGGKSVAANAVLFACFFSPALVFYDIVLCVQLRCGVKTCALKV